MRERALRVQVVELKSDPRPNRDQNTVTCGQIYLELLAWGLTVSSKFKTIF